MPPDPPCIITEYLNRGSLQSVLDDKSTEISDSLKVRYAIGICRGMTYLHMKNILHLDLKPLNILVDRADNIKVADFGMSKIATKHVANHSSLQATNEQVGTVSYMSPEILDELPTVGKSADVFSFGICFYQILVRGLPYPGMTDVKIALGVVRGTVRPDLSALVNTWPLFTNLLKRCWAQLPEERPSFQDILSDLSETMEHKFLLKSF